MMQFGGYRLRLYWSFFRPLCLMISSAVTPPKYERTIPPMRLYSENCTDSANFPAFGNRPPAMNRDAGYMMSPTMTATHVIRRLFCQVSIDSTDSVDWIVVFACLLDVIMTPICLSCRWKWHPACSQSASTWHQSCHVFGSSYIGAHLSCGMSYVPCP